MDQDQGTAGPQVTAASQGEGNRPPEGIRADIERTREEVGDTVEALAAKTDVKARVHDRVENLKASVHEKTPDSAQAGGGAVVVAKVRANPVPVIGAAVVALAFILGRRS